MSRKKDLNKKLFSLKDFAAAGPYKLSYLYSLVRRGGLKAKKVGRNYFTTIEWFEDYLKNHSRVGQAGFHKDKLLGGSNKNRSDDGFSFLYKEAENLNKFLDKVLEAKEASNPNKNNSSKSDKSVIIPKVGGSNKQAEKNLQILVRQKKLDYRLFLFLKNFLIGFKKHFLNLTSWSWNYSKEIVKIYIKQFLNLLKLLFIFPITTIGTFLFLAVGVLTGFIYKLLRGLYDVPGNIIASLRSRVNFGDIFEFKIFRFNVVAFILFFIVFVILASAGAPDNAISRFENKLRFEADDITLFFSDKFTNSVTQKAMAQASENINYFKRKIASLFGVLADNISQRNKVLARRTGRIGGEFKFIYSYWFGEANNKLASIGTSADKQLETGRVLGVSSASQVENNLISQEPQVNNSNDKLNTNFFDNIIKKIKEIW